MKMTKKPLASMLLAVGLSATVATPAFAATTRSDRLTITSVSVSTSDLDLASPEGQRTLQNRVAKAVRGACRVTDFDTGQRLLNRDVRACLAKARASADRQVAALLTDEQRGG
jgi:UrcA family protein